jgi:nitrogen fixation protein NifB
VLIPGVNDAHLIKVNKAVKSRGAFLHNIMPLISDPAHGTFFGLTGQRGPTPRELKKVQDACEGGAKLMRHCRQCRADAVGMLGEDRGQEFTLDRLPEKIEIDFSQRDAWRAEVEKKRATHRAAKTQAGEALRRSAPEKKMTIAVATRGDGVINQHFGHAKEFQIYEVDARGVRFAGHRKIDDQYCQGGLGEDSSLSRIVKMLAGVDALLCAKIGACPKGELTQAGITPSDEFAFEYIEPSVASYFAKHASKTRENA